MPETQLTPASTQRRRSERVVESLPIIVRGVDLLGQPFEERTATLAFNLHGCRYPSRYHLPKNTWVTLEIARGSKLHNVRARVAWVQRPRSVRELFQVAVELESAANIWEHEPVPPGWSEVEAAAPLAESFSAEANLRLARESEVGTALKSSAVFREGFMSDQPNVPIESAPISEPPSAAEVSPLAEGPFLRDLRAALETQAMESVRNAAAQANEMIRRTAEELAEKRAAGAEDAFRRWMGDFENAQSAAREQFSTELSSRQEQFLSGLKAEFEENFSRARRILEDLDVKAEAIRKEAESAADATSRMAQARLQFEAVEAARAAQPAAPAPRDPATEEAAATQWRERLNSEMSLALSQWNELLQSSLDGGIERLVGRLSERSQDFARRAEQEITERLGALELPFSRLSSEASENLAAMKGALEGEISHARSSLSEIEHSAGRMKEYSAQLEAASHDALNELHRRLEKILETHTEEMVRRVEALANGLSQRVAPSLDSMGRQFVDRTVGEVEAKLNPHLERVPALLRELASREVQSEDALRLHRERLRQLSENNQRESAVQLAATLANLRGDFEAARKEALAKWNEEIEASGVRASHAAAESISKTSEWLQQEARARLQVIVEQGLAAAGTGLEEKSGEASQKFLSQLDVLSAAHVDQMNQRADSLAAEAEGRARTQLEKAAQEAAAAFGQVLRGISENETAEFANRSRGVAEQSAAELQNTAGAVLRNFEANAVTSLDKFQAQLTAQVEAGAVEGRRALETESASALEAFRGSCQSREGEFALGLERAAQIAAEKFQERLETTGDTWVVSSVRRLNEHGQDSIESLMRSADLSLRDSCAKFFEGLAQSLRERGALGSGAPGFQPFAEKSGASAEPASGSSPS